MGVQGLVDQLFRDQTGGARQQPVGVGGQRRKGDSQRTGNAADRGRWRLRQRLQKLAGDGQLVSQLDQRSSRCFP